jgi:hypothetical protein
MIIKNGHFIVLHRVFGHLDWGKPFISDGYDWLKTQLPAGIRQILAERLNKRTHRSVSGARSGEPSMEGGDSLEVPGPGQNILIGLLDPLRRACYCDSQLVVADP